jgi:hypothetical protein
MDTQTFNPADFAFEWTPDWYDWDSAAAHNMARDARDTEAKRLKAQGFRVKKWSSPNQLITRGGIGTPHPEIDMVVTVYCVTIRH